MSRASHRIWSTIAAVALLTLSLVWAAPAADAASGQLGQPQITLNPGGGSQATGVDGLRFVINGNTGQPGASPGQDQAYYRGTYQYCCSAGGPMLNIGGTLFGQAGPARSTTGAWTSLTLVSSTGAVSTGTPGTATGNAEVVVRYVATAGGLQYTVTRTVSYTYPNNYVTDSYAFDIPAGNTAQVKFYLGGDTAPGSSDTGYGVMLTNPVRSVISLNGTSHILFGFREVSGSKAFDGATSQSYNTPYATVQTGGNIGFVATTANHDAGLMVQWNLGSTPGTQTAALEQFVNQQGTNLTASFDSTDIGLGQSVNLQIPIENTQSLAQSGIG